MGLIPVKTIKTVVAICAMVFFVSCEDELISDVDGLINNNNLKKEVIELQPSISTVNIDTVRTSGLSTYLLGDYQQANLGRLQASIVSQVLPSSYPLKRIKTSHSASEVTSVVDEVTLEMPYTMSFNSTTNTYEYTNLVGDANSTVDFEVNTFTTYLEEYNTNGTARVYYGNGENNANVKESLGTQTNIGELKNYVLPSASNKLDTLKISLNKTYFQSNFINNLDAAAISNADEMKAFFKGVAITAKTVSGSGYVVPFNLSKANLVIKYTNTVTATGATSSETINLKFDDVIFNLYNHDHNNTNALERAYIQGAGGYELSVDVSGLNAHSANSIAQNWLINQAKLKIYVDASAVSETDQLTSLYVYAYSDSKATVVEDYKTFGASTVGGTLQYEDATNKTNPYFELFITDFIKAALAKGTVKTLRIKAKESKESTTIDFKNTQPKGVVLLNNATAKLIVNYSKIE